jgi:hypothetical protein
MVHNSQWNCISELISGGTEILYFFLEQAFVTFLIKRGAGDALLNLTGACYFLVLLCMEAFVANIVQ